MLFFFLARQCKLKPNFLYAPWRARAQCWSSLRLACNTGHSRSSAGVRVSWKYLQLSLQKPRSPLLRATLLGNIGTAATLQGLVDRIIRQHLGSLFLALSSSQTCRGSASIWRGRRGASRLGPPPCLKGGLRELKGGLKGSPPSSPPAKV